MSARIANVILIIFLLLCSPLSGCFGEDDSGLPSANDLEINGSLIAGDWSKVTLYSNSDLSVYIPYFVIDP